MELTLRNPAELVSRLELTAGRRLLLVDPPDALEEIARQAREGKGETDVVEGRKIRTVKDTFDAAVVWREERVGSQALLAGIVKRLEPDGALWVIVALKKVMGVATPAAHRLDLSDLTKAFSPAGLSLIREARVSPWHVGYRFGGPGGKNAGA